MSRQRFVITDNSGRTATVEVQMINRILSDLPTSDRSQHIGIGPISAHWQALTLGAFGAQSGLLSIYQGSGNENFSHSCDLALRAQLRQGVWTNLLILKRWYTNRGLSREGTGTLLHGVNLGLRSGEVTWSEIH